MIRVFVYGTLKPGESQYVLCADRVISSQSAIAHASLYHLQLGYPAIVPGNGRTYGYLLTFQNAEILEILDDYEQHDPTEIEPFGSGNDYQRQEIEVFDLNQISLGKAWAYVMMQEQVDRLKGVLTPSGIWQKNRPQ
ncbi:hypothetical protein NIES2135_03250 [Leptolyngbya boryana NIES-2135]|jgi:gamma-glutamylcyclotransferase (GGCT)/AIG2-like uncharacterized protein YtfP|uniref:Gamma-glutamylcyclotransferase AIG2-like domain-containing protein n=1 Tax=Leptolyngbya boryana NIES-2135 TaxID=1973484 RepID=A0A1Z4J9R7_LEPBY|nr:MULTISPECIES: gamma-glutamylcyclotransferase family protein [Leptolyngbya]ULP30483.1 gamma-glutamylcyclotransferase [Leptolyngbya boryana IU 594]BAS54422.1 conserved hypothetical protein [Leptolyngbya boryana IAM M-101]BAS60770.1 conserved hypothetical protein [Leptolyngbya boryana dg5]BAY53519.1 hypothetical protein NIES2135_03250 [Leptolyngbya boryana NIES-2135]